MKWFREYKYKNITFSFLSIFFTFILFKIDLLKDILLSLENLIFIGPLVAGMLFVSSFTTTLGILIILELTKTLHPLYIALVAGAGAVIGDFAIFSFFKNNLLGEIRLIYHNFQGERLTKILRNKYLKWTIPLIGAAIIASPFPDELGICFMGISKIKNYQFIVLSFMLNSVGIFLFASALSLGK